MSTRAERRKRVAARVVAGDLPARRVSALAGQALEHVRAELADKRSELEQHRRHAPAGLRDADEVRAEAERAQAAADASAALRVRAPWVSELAPQLERLRQRRAAL